MQILFKKKKKSNVSESGAVSELGRLRQDNHMVTASPSYIANSRYKTELNIPKRKTLIVTDNQDGCH